MSQYLTGTAALADARLRVDGMPASQGALVVEGRDDLITFADRASSLQGIIVCGNKPKLLEAFARSTAQDRARMLFVADRDYDVPAGRLQPKQGLVLSVHADREADLVALGVVRAAVLRAIPAARSSDAKADAITSDVTEKAIELAEAVGRLRHASAVQGMGLLFSGLDLRRFRNKHTGEVDQGRIIETVRQRSSGNPSTEELKQRSEEAPGGIKVCNGKDLVQAVGLVIHHEHNVSLADLDFVPELFRSIDSSLFGRWEVARRVKQWEQQTGRQILR